MKINISKSSVVGEIKGQFNSGYPFLKLEFIVPGRMSNLSKNPAIADDRRRLGDIQPGLIEGAMLVDDLTTVSELENFFQNHLLNVQVFRKSENLWLETTMTDAWTLQKQNNHGKEISEFIKISRQGSKYGNDIVNDVS